MSEIKESALSKQVDGSHYKDMQIQPIIYIYANNIPFIEGNVIKYVSRWKNKNGIKDLEKARHLIDMLIEFESTQSQDK
jgi:hypothetical protein